ncbi:MAG TPA: DEAD/DEAH box helicase [Thermoanaerobaculia bacterium]|jgi:SNF2 family DNA or RNA helicase|nr:DEAD/DEAH box helicase [Thermoanaerobaculia bacterium]
MLAAHQTEAAARALALLRSHRGAILADDVGLGKSYVAAEVMRHFEEVDLIVPAALVGQWRATVAQFGVAATLLTHDALLRDTYVAEARERLVVVDEAHAFRNPATQRYAALARRTAGARVLLVTATPVCNGLGDLEALLRLIARDDVLARDGVPSIDVAFATRDRALIARIVAALIIRRDRSVLPEELQFGELERRVVRHPVANLAIDALQFPLVEDAAILRRFLWRRLESSEAAFLESLRRQQRFYERALAAVVAGRTLSKRDYRRAFTADEEFQEVLFWDLFAPKGDSDPHAIRDELQRIDALIEQARATPRTKRALLDAVLTGEPTLIFTGSAATARDLHASLRQAGLVTSRERSREAVLDAFRNGKLDTVVSTDMAAEGLNLQRAAMVIHYDVPWNPVKLDQRNGRAHRIGQQRESVRAIYFLPESRQTRIIETVARKNRERRRSLVAGNRGESVSPTLRPRVARDAAVLRLKNPPELLLRRHKAGIERLIQENCRLSDLLALVAIECFS